MKSKEKNPRVVDKIKKSVDDFAIKELSADKSQEELAMKAESLRRTILKELEQNESGINYISMEDWEEIYTSIPGDLLEMFEIHTPMELKMFVFFGEKLSEVQKELFAMELPEIKEEKDVDVAMAILLKIDLKIFVLGLNRQEGNYDRERVYLHIKLFTGKLDEALNDVDSLLHNNPSSSVRKKCETLKSIITDLGMDINKFKDGSFYRKLNYRPLIEGASEHDANYDKVKYDLDDVDVGFVSPRWKEYYESDLLDESLEYFIQYGIPPETIELFLSFLDDENKSRLCSSDTEIIAEAFSSGHTSKEVMEFCAALIRNNIDLDNDYNFDPWMDSKYVSYIHSNNPLIILYSSVKGSSFKEKISRIQSYHALGLDIIDISILDKFTDITPEKMRELIISNHRVFSAKEIFKMTLQNVDPKRLMPIISKIGIYNISRNTGLSLQSIISFSESLSDDELAESLKYLDLFYDVTWQWENAIIYFVENKTPVSEIDEFQRFGFDLDEIYKSFKSGMTLDYVSSFVAENRSIDPSFILDSYIMGLKVDDVRPLLTVLGVNKDELQISSYLFYARNKFSSTRRERWRLLLEDYLHLVNTEENTSKFIKLSENGVNIPQCLLAIDYNLPVEEVLWGKSMGATVSQLKKMKGQNLRDTVEFLHDQGISISKLTIGNLITIKDKKLDENEILQMKSSPRGFPSAVYILESGEDWRKVVNEYGKLFESFTTDNILLLSFLEIPQEEVLLYIESYSDDIDAIIAHLASENKIPQKSIDFLEKYNLSFPSRCPTPILKNMSNNYESTEKLSKPKALITATKTDWNGAFSKNSWSALSLLKGYDVYVYEVSSDTEFVDTVRKFGVNQQKIDLLLIKGHGTPDGISLSSKVSGEASHIDTGDIEQIGLLKDYFDDSSVVVLDSCSTGKGGSNNNNIASKISKSLMGILVIAPGADSELLEYDFDEKNLVKDVKYLHTPAEHISVK